MGLDQIQEDLAKIASLPPDILPSVIITAVALVLVLAVRAFALKLTLRRMDAPSSRIRLRRNSAYFSALALILILFPIWLPSLRSIAAFLGIFGAGVLLVHKEAILNLAGWFYVISRKPFEIGNRISIGAFTGDVLDIRLLDFSIIEVSRPEDGGQSTGRVIHVPNAMVFSNPFANASKEFAFNWNEIHIPLTLESDWQLAVKIVETIAANVIEKISEGDRRIRHSEREYAIRFKRMTPRIYVEFREGTIVLTLRHLVEPRTNRMVMDQFWRKFLARISREKKIHLAGPPGH